jgi:hypothetical protein
MSGRMSSWSSASRRGKPVRNVHDPSHPRNLWPDGRKPE